MKPVYQTQFGIKGNCFAACLASLLEIDLDSIPDFYWEHKSNWYIAFQAWLQQFGLTAIILSLNCAEVPADCYYLVGGPTERGLLHSCIAFNGKIVHDPYPGGNGLLKIVDFTFFVKTFKEQDS